MNCFMNTNRCPSNSPGFAFSRRYLGILAILILGAHSMVPGLNAAVTTLYHYRLGENDPGAVAARPIHGTVDREFKASLTSVEPPVYSAVVSDLAAARLPSTLAAEFNGTNQYLRHEDVLPLPSNNFGVELWVRPARRQDGFSIVAYCGDTQFDGWGFYQNGPDFGVSFGSVGRFGAVRTEIGQWIHLALVRDQEISTLYSNGVAVAQSTLGVVGTYTAGFALGAHPQHAPDEFFAGTIDEVRIFQFDPGAFDVSDLLVRRSLRTLPAVQFNRNQATLRADVWGTSEPTLTWFEWGESNAFANQTAATLVASDSGPVEISAVVDGLQPGLNYVYRAVASNALAVTRGFELTFQIPIRVTSLENDGPGSLRDAISNAPPGATLVLATNGIFQLSGSGLVLNRDVSIVGQDPAVQLIDGGDRVRPFYVAPGVTATFSDVTIQRGKANDGVNGRSDGQNRTGGEPGGGVLNRGNLRLTRCILRRNAAGNGGTGQDGATGAPGGDGGGIANFGSLDLDQCLFEENFAGNGGRGGWGMFPGSPGENGAAGGAGGALWSSALCQVVDSTFVNNVAGDGGAGGDGHIFVTSQPRGGRGGNGGSGGAIANLGEFTLTQSTLSGNQSGRAGPNGNVNDAPPSLMGEGGAIINAFNLQILACTVVSNRAFGETTIGGVFNLPDVAVAILQSSIIAGNQTKGSSADLGGAFQSVGYNLIGAMDARATGLVAGVNHDQAGTVDAPLDARLAPLVRQTPTASIHRVLPGSPAMGAGDDAILAEPWNLVRDQIGVPRLTGTHVEIGACAYGQAWFIAEVSTDGSSTGSDPITGSWSANLAGSVNLKGVAGLAYFEFGKTTQYGLTIVDPLAMYDDRLQKYHATIPGLVPGGTYHFRAAASNELGVVHGQDLSLTIPDTRVLGDGNGDGLVSGAELARVFANYQSAPLWLQIVQPAGLGETNVTFSLGGEFGSPFIVESSTDLATWTALGVAIPRYEFLDTNSPGPVARFYRLKVRNSSAQQLTQP